MSTEEPLFLTRPQIERLHDRSLMKFGGSAGVGDEGLIQSALASAKNAYFYGRGDLFDIAAAYAFHIAEGQAFLEVNGMQTSLSDDVLHGAMIDIAEKRLNKAGLAKMLRDSAKPI